MLNTNDNYENDKLMREIEQLDNDPAIDTMEEYGSKKKTETLLLAVIIAIIVVCAAFVYITSDNADVGTLVPVKESTTDNHSKGTSLETTVPVVDEDYDYVEGYDDDSEERNRNAFIKQKENIVITQLGMNIEKQMMISIANKNNRNLYDMELYAIYYDGDNNIVDISDTSLEVLKSGSIRYLVLENTPKNYERLEVFLTKRHFWYPNKEYMYLDEKLECVVTENDDEINVSFKNKSDERIDVASASIIYYDEQGKILNIGQVFEYDVKKNKTAETSDYVLWNYNDGEKPYDHYAIIINYAINYGY